MSTFCHFSNAIEIAHQHDFNSRHGALIVIGGKVLAMAHNDLNGHAEINALTQYRSSRHCFEEA